MAITVDANGTLDGKNTRHVSVYAPIVKKVLLLHYYLSPQQVLMRTKDVSVFAFR